MSPDALRAAKPSAPAELRDPGLVVRTGTVDGAVVLSDVEIDGPRAQRARHGAICFRHRGPVAVRKELVLRGVVSHGEEHGVRHIRLEAESPRPVYQLQQFHVPPPTVGGAPGRFVAGQIAAHSNRRVAQELDENSCAPGSPLVM